VPDEIQETVNFRSAILLEDAVDENTPTTPHYRSSLLMEGTLSKTSRR